MGCLSSTRRLVDRQALCVAALALLLATALAGGKKKKPPTEAVRPGAPNAATIVCPPGDQLARMIEKEQPGRAVRVACVVFAPGYYWLAAALSFDPKTKSDARVHLVTGAQPPRIFDVEPAPAPAIAQLIQKSDEVAVQIRKSGSETRLVRMGVVGSRGGAKGDADEVGIVLQLAAHAPPKLLWVGPGDEVRTSSDGCRLEQRVDFEMPFGSRLEMITSPHAKGGPACTGGIASQQQIDYKAIALKPSRPLPAP